MTRRSSNIFVSILLLVSLGCGGDADPIAPPTNPLERVTLSQPSSASFGKVHLSGLPSAKRMGKPRVLLFVDGVDPFELLVDVDVDGTYFWAPLHPGQPNEGGSVRVVVMEGVDESPPLLLDIEALPAASGAFETVVAALRAHIEQRAAWAASSFDELRASAFDEVDDALIPTKIAQTFVDSEAAADNDLTSLIENDAGFLSADERELLDRLFGFAPIDLAIQAEIDEFEPVSPRKRLGGFAGRGDRGKRVCLNVGPDISTAEQLSDAMLLAALGDIATDTSTGAGRSLAAAGLVLSVGGMLPGYGPVFSAVGVAVASLQASKGYQAGAYPSSFISLDFEIDRTEFPEDEPGFAQWSNVNVVAASKGWVADKDIANIVLTAVGGALGATEKAKILGSSFLRDAAITGFNLGFGQFIDSQGGLIEICAMRWTVDITDLPYSTGQALDRRLDVDPATRQVRPKEVGADFLRVAAQSSKFAGRKIWKDVAMQTKPIVVDVSPAEIYVTTLGETVQITAQILNADLETLLWETEKGSWDDGVGVSTNGPRTRPLKTPTNAADYPFFVTVESSSGQGLRSSGEPRRMDIATVRYQSASILVTPSGICVANDASEQFSAEIVGGENLQLVWSLEDPSGGMPSGSGSVDGNGLYTSPSAGMGTVFVVATSVANANVVGKSLVSFGACVCYWTFDVAGDKSFAGDSASHQFPSGSSSVFALTIAQGSPGEPGAGFAQVIGSPGEGQTGSWPAIFFFSDGLRSWGAGNDDDGTSAILTVTLNTTATIEGFVSGVCATRVGEDVFLRSFELNFRSGQLDFEQGFCEP